MDYHAHRLTRIKYRRRKVGMDEKFCLRVGFAYFASTKEMSRSKVEVSHAGGRGGLLESIRLRCGTAHWSGMDLSPVHVAIETESVGKFSEQRCFPQ